METKITKMSLSAWREYRGYSQKEIAEKINKTPSALSLYEHGKRPIPQPELDQLMKIYKCPYEMIAF